MCARRRPPPRRSQAGRAASHYHHPEAYAALFDPDADELARIERLVLPHVGWIGAVLDPACGPGCYLVPFAAAGCRVAGNDLEPAMLAHARERLEGCEAELTLGDMRCLRFASGPFDLALNLNLSLGHLPDDAAVLEHLQAVAANLRPGGVYLVSLTLLPQARTEARSEVVHRSPWAALPGGGQSAAIVYTSTRRDPVRRRECIEVCLRLRDGSPDEEVIVEEYELLTFTVPVVRTLIEAADFDLVGVHAIEPGRWPPIELDERVEGDVLLVLRCR